VDRQTRQQLKHDEFRDSLEVLEEYFKKHYQDIITVVLLVVVVVGIAGALKYFNDRQQAAADADLGAALKTFRAYVGTPDPSMGPDVEAFPSAEAKYKKALGQFSAIVQKYRMFPRPKAVTIARYHLGVCQALAGDRAAGIKTLEAVGQDRDREMAALARFALASELVKNGNLPEAAKTYQALADHPTLSVPKATALLALAEAYRDSQPARARQIYLQVQNEFGADSRVADALKQEMAGLPQ